MTFDLRGGTAGAGFVASTTAFAGGTVALSIPSKTGFVFAGWYTGDTVNDGIFTTTDKVTGNLALVARWNPVKVTVTFKDYYGDTVDVVTVNYGSSVTPPAVPSNIGKLKFLSWDKNVELAAVTADITVSAIYVVNGYTVKFETDGGSAVADVMAYVGEIPAKPDAPEKAGFTFAGWFFDRAYTQEYKFDKALNANTTLYAKFNGDYIMITTAADLVAIAKDPTAKYMLANDINLKGDVWTPIDTFSGVLDGAGHRIFNFVITESDKTVGFIRENSGTIKNLILDDYYFSISCSGAGAGMIYAGLLVGDNSGTISDCTVTNNGTFKSAMSYNRSSEAYHALTLFTGAVAGRNTGVVENVSSGADIVCDFSASINEYSTYANMRVKTYTGGITGGNSGTVSQCEYEGKITADRYAGKYSRANMYMHCYLSGIAGIQESTGKIERCSSNAVISVNEKSGSSGTRENYIGSTCALNNGGKVTDCVATGSIAHTGNETSYVGGAVAKHTANGTISNSYTSVEISEAVGGSYVGGIVGICDANCTIKASCAEGNITISGNSTNYGYVIGKADSGSTCFKCYYSSSAVITVGGEVKAAGTCTEGIAKTLDELHSTALLVDTLYWDTDIWNIGFGVPTLK